MPNPTITALRSRKFTVRVRGAAGAPAHNVTKIIFDKNDGSLYVGFPYFAHTEGVVSIITLNPGDTYPRQVSYVQGGKVTSHLVKYSHHPDGRAQFSQDGKVISAVRKQSIPLNEYVGHIFTIQIQRLEGFRKGKGPDVDPRNEKDQPVTVNLFGTEPRGLKLLGHWFPRREVLRHAGKKDIGPAVGFIPGGILLSAPRGTPGAGYFLVLSAWNVPPLTPTPTSELTFAGGFDRFEIMNDNTKTATFLWLSYPETNLNKLKPTIGSIDLKEK